MQIIYKPKFNKRSAANCSRVSADEKSGGSADDKNSFNVEYSGFNVSLQCS